MGMSLNRAGVFSSSFGKCVALLALLVLSLPCVVSAQSSISWGEEYARRLGASQAVDPLRDTSTGEQISLFNGATSFSATDISVPGNSALPVELNRSWDIQNEGIETLSMGDWVVDVPNISGTFLANVGWPDQRCTTASPPPGHTYGGGTNQYAVVLPYEYWSGYRLSAPGGIATLLRSKADDAKIPLPSPGLGANSPWTTSDGWRFSCLSALQNGSGEGFVAHAPDGRKYTFDWMVVDLYRPIVRRGVSPAYAFLISRHKIKIYATKIEDRFGNWVRYDWSGSRLQRVYANDGREIVLAYNAEGRLASATSSGRTWLYEYSPFNTVVQANTHYLRSVTQPDGSQWKYDAGAFVRSIVYKRASYYDANKDADGYLLQGYGYCNQDRVILSGGGTYAITSPSGARFEYVFSPMRHGRKNVYEDCMDTDSPLRATNSVPLHQDVLSLTRKSISGVGVSSLVLQYQYAGMDPGYKFTGNSTHDNITNATPVPNYKTVRITRSDGLETVNVFGRDFGVNEGRLFRVESRKAGAVHSSTTYEYVPIAALSAQNFPNYSALTPQSVEGVNETMPWPVYRTSISQDGVAFVSQVPLCNGNVYCFDAFGRPTRTIESSALGQLRTNIVDYYDNLADWVVGLPLRTTNVETGMVESEVEYNAQSLPWRTYRFGKLQQTLIYAADGTVATVADGNGNVTTVSGWKRGIPQLITHPGGTTQSATVNDNGWITSITDENGFVTGYGYDAMGRLASIVQPTGDTLAGGATAYHTTWSHFGPVLEADWRPAGISTGQWRKVEGTGDHVTITYMNALWQPILVHDYDQGNVATSLRATRTEYDSSGRVSFQSYPSSDQIPGATGTRTFYDALDRVVRVEQDSEMGVLATTTEYLSGLRTRVTSPRGQQVTTSFMAWDQPNYDLPILSEQPEGKVIQIDRHPQFGWPLALTQRNTANTLSATRRYVYDGNAQLCKTIEPETGATVMGYDAAGNLAWSSAGLDRTAFGSLSDCQHDAAYTSGRTSTRTYDARNRLSQLLFPDGRGNQVWTYTPDSLPASITTYNDTGNTVPVVMAYTYNKRRLLTGESITQYNGATPWYTWTIGYAYNAYGHLASQTYPTGLVVDYAPNPLGQPTKAGSYASGAQYYPNGALKQFTYGNGIVHTMQQNARQLPSRVTSSGGVNDFTYNYDANGNVTNIWDLARGDNYSRWLSYDNLDRLTAAGSASFGGDAWHRMTYDALDNLESWKLAGVKDYADYVYDNQNRLMSIRNTAGATVVGLDYDLQGNLSNKNGQTYNFDYGNRLRRANGKESYRYDGLGRRVQTTADNGKTTLWQYSQGGQMLFSSDWGGPDNQAQQTHEHVYLAGSIIATIDHAWPSNAVLATKYQHTDALGSPVAVTNAAGQVIERMDYEPWGAIIGNPTRSGIGYTGHVMDGATGLTYMQQRYYDQSVGRFLSVDPLQADFERGEDLNRYAYVSNNPYGNIDPDGMKTRPFSFAHRPRTPLPGSATPVVSGVPKSSQRAPYNCHSYAWHHSQGDPTDKRNAGLPPRWDNNPSDDMAEATKLSPDAPNQVDDIVVYGRDKNGNGRLEPSEIDHSARVTQVDADGYTTRVRGKEGQAEITDHHPLNQNPAYGSFIEWYRPKKDEPEKKPEKKDKK